MAQVPYSEGVQSVEPRGAPPDDYQHIQATPEMFGGQIATGLQKLGAGETTAAKFFGHVAANDVWNDAADQATKLLHGDPSKTVQGPDGKPMQDTGYFGLEGRAQLQARPAVEQQLDEIIKNARGKLQTPDQELEFDTISRRYRQYWAGDVGTAADKAAKSYYAQVANQTIKESQDRIARHANDPSPPGGGPPPEVSNAIADMARTHEEAAIWQGGTPDDLKRANAQAKKDGTATWIRAVAASGDFAKAQRMIEKNKDVLGTDVDALSNEVRTRADQQIGNAWGDTAHATSNANHAFANVALPIWNQTTQAIPAGYSPFGLARTIRIESSGNPNAVNGNAVGLGQFMPATAAQVGLTNRRDPYQSIEATQKLAADNRPVLAAALGRDPTDAELYLAHQQGAAGAAKLIANPDARAGDLVGDAAIRANGGNPNAPAWVFTNMWIGKFNGAQGWATPAGLATPGEFAAPPSSRKANAYQIVQAALQKGDITDVQADHAITRINRLDAMQNISEANTEKENKALVNTAEGEYFAAARQGTVTPELMMKLEADPRFASDEVKRKDVYNYLATAGGAKKSLIDFGSGWLSFKDRILSDPGTPGHIADSREIMKATMPGGPLTPAGGDDLLKLYGQVRKDLNDEQKMALHDNKATVEKEAYRLLTFESPEMEQLKLRDPKGRTIFGKWLMQFNADYSREAAKGDTNMFEWLKTQMDGLPKTTSSLRSEAQKAMDRVSAVGEAAGEKIEPTIPPPLPGIEAAPWAEVMSVRPIMKNGAPLPPQNWAQAMQILRNDPSEQNKKIFNEHWQGFDADTVLKKLGGVVPSGLSPPGEIAPIEPQASNLGAADAALKLTPQEKNLYERHLKNLNGPGGVDNPDGSRSTLYQAVVEGDGKFYNIPTVWDGKILPVPQAIQRAAQVGWDKFPSYKTAAEADARYEAMHKFMERDTADYLKKRPAPSYSIHDTSGPGPAGYLGNIIRSITPQRAQEYIRNQ